MIDAQIRLAVMLGPSEPALVDEVLHEAPLSRRP